MKHIKIGGIVEQCNLAMYTITTLSDKPGSAGEILKIFAIENINLEYITEGVSRDGQAILSFCVDAAITNKLDSVIKTSVEAQSHSIRKIEYVCILGIYGPHFREKSAIAARFCMILGNADVNILGISSSISTISCVIDIRDRDKAKDAILGSFELP